MKVILALSALFLSLTCQTILAENPTMKFKNLRGSILELKLLADNKVTGYFTTAVASKTCPEAINTKMQLRGYIVGNALSFSVVYPMCESVLSVSGNFDKDKSLIDTISVLAKQAPDIKYEGPGARFIGHDDYQKIA